MIKVIDRDSGAVYGALEGLTSSPCHAYMHMGATLVRFRDADGVPWELPLTEVALG